MVVISVAVAIGAGTVGLNLSFFDRSLPTGPFVVLVLSLAFVTAYLASPRYGVIIRAVRRWRQVRRTKRENGLKSIYLALADGRQAQGIPLARLADFRKESPATTRHMVRGLARHGWALIDGDVVFLTEHGAQRARELDRNYRLWELFLTHEVQLPPDHTQRDAENIEHILGPDLVRELEARYDRDHA